VHDERVEVVGQALGGGGVAGLVELGDQGLESLPGVVFVDGVIQCLPVGGPDAFALRFGQLGQQVAHAVHTAVLAVRGGPALLDGLDQSRRAVGDDQQRRSQSAGDEIASQRKPVLV
jgi:hypothetical protein